MKSVKFRIHKNQLPSDILYLVAKRGGFLLSVVSNFDECRRCLMIFSFYLSFCSFRNSASRRIGFFFCNLIEQNVLHHEIVFY
jgi:hypothetical protein